MTDAQIMAVLNENARLKAMVLALAERVAAQSELLAKRAAKVTPTEPQPLETR